MSDFCNFWVEGKGGKCCEPANKFIYISGFESLPLCQKHYDFCRCPHQTLLTMLRTKFKNILYPDPLAPNQTKVQIGFYDEYGGFLVGHRKRELMPEIDATIRRRAQRFLDLASSEKRIVFVRLRNHYFSQDAYLEPVFSDGVISMFEEEQREIVQALTEIGFKNFEVFYIVNSHMLTLDGFITIPEGLLSPSMYCMEDPEGFTGKNWRTCFNHFIQNYAVSGLG